MILNYRQARVAAPAPVAYILLKTLAQVVVFWSFFLFALPAVIWHIETRLSLGAWHFGGEGRSILGALIFIAGGALGLSSGAIMAWKGKGTPMSTDCAPLLVIAGPYRYIRNPMALAGLAQGVAVGLYLGSPCVVLYALAGGPVWNYGVRPWEEADLSRRFGAPYDRYRSKVRCWLPRFTPYNADADNLTLGRPLADNPSPGRAAR